MAAADSSGGGCGGGGGGGGGREYGLGRLRHDSTDEIQPLPPAAALSAMEELLPKGVEPGSPAA